MPAKRRLGFSADPGFRALKAGDGAWSVYKTLFVFRAPFSQLLISKKQLLHFLSLCSVVKCLIQALWSAIEQNDPRFIIIFISYFFSKRRGPPGDILLIWGGRGWYSKHFVKFWIWVYSPFACKWPLKLLNKRLRLKHKNLYKSVIWWPILMKFCMQAPIRHPFALANFQLGRKGHLRLADYS